MKSTLTFLVLSLVTTTAAYSVGCSSSSDSKASPTEEDGGPSSDDDGDHHKDRLDGGLDPDADPLASCKGIALDQDGTWDIDLKAAHVHGAVTLNGAKKA